MNRIVKINMVMLLVVVAAAGLVFLFGNASPVLAADERHCGIAEVKEHLTSRKIIISNGSDNASWVITNGTDCWFQIYMWSGRLIGISGNQLPFFYGRDIVHSFVSKTYSIPVPKDCGYQFDLGYGVYEPPKRADGFIDLNRWNSEDWLAHGLAGGLIGSPCTLPTPTPTPTPTPSATPTPTPKPNVEKSIDVSKTDNRDITRPGHSLTYVITVKNTGKQDLSDVKLTDTVPSQLTVTSVGNGGSHSGNTITWSGISLGAGETKQVTFKATVKSAAPNGHVLDNKVKARSEDHDVQDEADDRTVVQRQAVVLAAVATPVPAPIAVPVTAKTGAGALSAILTTLMGATGLVVTLKKAK